jgi:GR25 family glycosyltransferase involved in LPS biosynthesis
MNGRFINLQGSIARREAMELQLRALGLHGIARLEATDTHGLPAHAALPDAPVSPREHACFLSHARAIDSAPPGDFFLVLEDDALLSRALPPLLRQPEALAQLEGFDLVFLECMPSISATSLLPLWQAMSKHLPHAQSMPRDAIDGIEILDARSLYNWGAVAYLVTPKGLRTLPALLREALAAGPALAFDMTLNALVHDGRIRAAVLAPFLATPALHSHAQSTIDDRPRALENDALAGALRRLFFAGPLDGLDAHVGIYRHAALTQDPQLQLLADLMAQLFVIAARPAR